MGAGWRAARDLNRTAGEVGILGANYPEAVGGGGGDLLDVLESTVLIEWLRGRPTVEATMLRVVSDGHTLAHELRQPRRALAELSSRS